MSQSKLRSTEVQGVISSSPNFFIGWGNTIILSLILMALFISSKIKINNKETLPCRIESYSVENNVPVIRLSVNQPLPENLNQSPALILSFPTSTHLKQVNAKINSIDWQKSYINAEIIDVMHTENSDKKLLNDGICSMQIIFKPKSMLQSMLEKIMNSRKISTIIFLKTS